MTETDRTYCNNCNAELPHKYYKALGLKPLEVSFKDITERNVWLKLTKNYGFKVWIK